MAKRFDAFFKWFFRCIQIEGLHKGVIIIAYTGQGQ